MIPDLDPNSDAKKLQIFLQPYLENPHYEHFRESYPTGEYLTKGLISSLHPVNKILNFFASKEFCCETVYL